MEGPIWQLACVKITEREWDEYDSNNPRSVLPKTKYLAAPGDFNTKELQEWVRTTSPQDKEVRPTYCYAIYHTSVNCSPSEVGYLCDSTLSASVIFLTIQGSPLFRDEN